MGTARPALDAIPVMRAPAYVSGGDGEAVMLQRLRTRSRGLPVVAPCASIVEALRALGAGCVALFDPPWFDAELNALGAAYYRAAGLDVASSLSCALPSDQSEIEPSALFEFVRRQVPTEAEAVVFGGNGFRVVGVIAALERELERLVVSPNQALLWETMRAVGARTDSITRYGRLFASP